MIDGRIIMLAGSAIGSVESNSRDAREAAAKAIAQADIPYAGASAVTVCVAKGRARTRIGCGRNTNLH